MEGLRAFAAAAVLHCHLCFPGFDVDPAFAPPIAAYVFQAGQGAVLLFFVISGYVIGLTNSEPFSAQRGVDYLKRRLVRLYPLYLVAVLLGAFVIREAGWWPVVANALMMETPLPVMGHIVPLLQGNSNLWSLQYEVVYYVLFLWLWACRVQLSRLIVACTIIVILGWLTGNLPAVLINYAAGWLFWIGGLWLARVPATTQPTPLPWPSLLLVFSATWNMKPLTLVMDRLGFAQPVTGWININVLEFLPVCVALLIAVTARRPKGWALWTCSAFIPAAMICVWKLKRGQFSQDYLAPYEWLTVAALSLIWWRPSIRAWILLAPLGFISYAVYALQRPVQWWVREQSWLPSGTPGSYIIRAVLIIALTLACAWFAEKKIQPWLRRKLLSVGTT